MDSKLTVKEFLVSRRERLTPEDVGMPNFSSNRRVKGLRREEVAMLAGVSVDYYIRLERGNLDGASESVLASIARALQLDETETGYFFDLAKASGRKPKATKRAAQSLRPNLQSVLDSFPRVPVFIRNSHLQILGTNQLGRAVYSPILASKVADGNMARFVFLDPAALDFYVDYQKIAEDTVGILRLAAIHDGDDSTFTQLLGELSAKSESFTKLWANHRVNRHVGGRKTFNHPEVGVMTFTYEPFQLVANDNLIMNVYTVEPGSESAQKLQLLGNLISTSERGPGGLISGDNLRNQETNQG